MGRRGVTTRGASAGLFEGRVVHRELVHIQRSRQDATTDEEHFEMLAQAADFNQEGSPPPCDVCVSRRRLLARTEFSAENHARAGRHPASLAPVADSIEADGHVLRSDSSEALGL